MGKESRPRQRDVRCPRGKPGVTEAQKRLASRAGSLQGEEPFGSECQMERATTVCGMKKSWQRGLEGKGFLMVPRGQWFSGETCVKV